MYNALPKANIRGSQWGQSKADKQAHQYKQQTWVIIFYSVLN
jgi:hypothetical protein